MTGAAVGNAVPPPVQLAVLLRLVQWHLDDVAHDLPAGRVTTAKRAELANSLETLAAVIRKQSPMSEP